MDTELTQNPQTNRTKVILSKPLRSVLELIKLMEIIDENSVIKVEYVNPLLKNALRY